MKSVCRLLCVKLDADPGFSCTALKPDLSRIAWLILFHVRQVSLRSLDLMFGLLSTSLLCWSFHTFLLLYVLNLAVKDTEDLIVWVFLCPISDIYTFFALKAHFQSDVPHYEVYDAEMKLSSRKHVVAGTTS